MSINSVQKAICTPSSSVVGKHKLPRYLYHFTSSKRALDIFESGAIKTSIKDFFFEKPAIFMVDMNNFLKYWKRFFYSQDANSDYSIMRKLLVYINDDGNGKLTCYKIPTEKLDADSLKIRSQDKMFKCDPDTIGNHLAHGDSALNKNLYNQRKEAVEYVYSKNIPLENAVKVGEAKIGPCERLIDYSEEQIDALRVLQELFRGEPEAKGIKAQLDKFV